MVFCTVPFPVRWGLSSFTLFMPIYQEVTHAKTHPYVVLIKISLNQHIARFEDVSTSEDYQELKRSF